MYIRMYPLHIPSNPSIGVGGESEVNEGGLVGDENPRMLPVPLGLYCSDGCTEI